MGPADAARQSLIRRIKRLLAVPWNYHGKKWLKKAYYTSMRWRGDSSLQTKAREFAPEIPFVKGDLVRVRSYEEILSTLDPFKELKGCAFLPEMMQYCGTTQLVLKSMQVFLDERDYKVKKARGVILLENVICNGTPAFGPCDRCCFLFWREEWLEKAAE
jgi:hypothetical protein